MVNDGGKPNRFQPSGHTPDGSLLVASTYGSLRSAISPLLVFALLAIPIPAPMLVWGPIQAWAQDVVPIPSETRTSKKIPVWEIDSSSAETTGITYVSVESGLDRLLK
ncbi:MAG: hypothetical protein KGQ51_16940, partial [Planctomycetes bacterium]|nr:hypothetical protein [Planctomycetota bacterium]